MQTCSSFLTEIFCVHKVHRGHLQHGQIWILGVRWLFQKQAYSTALRLSVKAISRPFQIKHIQRGQHGDNTDVLHLVEGEIEFLEVLESWKTIQVLQLAARHPQDSDRGESGTQVPHTWYATVGKPQLGQIGEVDTWQNHSVLTDIIIIAWDQQIQCCHTQIGA